MERVSVIGNTGSGKSTLAARLARILGAPHIELDALRHGPDWTETPDEVMRAALVERLEAPRWVVDGNYPMVRDLVWERADTVVWLDRPRHVVIGRLIRRTVTRLVRGVELWNGNRERWTNLLTIDPEQSVIAWAWTQHGVYRATYEEAFTSASRTPRHRVRLRTDRDVRRFLARAAS